LFLLLAINSILFSRLIMTTELQKDYAVEGINSSQEEVGLDLPHSAHLGGTDTDKHEMQVLGKVQQLNVRIYH
jgi:hypothetical protein